VERWARARGIWLEHGSSDRGDSPGWHVGNFASPVLIWFIHKTKYSEGFTSIVDHHTALVWALLVEVEATVDVGRCPACVKRGGPFEWRLSPTYHRYWD